MNPDLLQAFLAVADHRSFTRAAMTLNRTQSAVSMQVKRLEEQLANSAIDADLSTVARRTMRGWSP